MLSCLSSDFEWIATHLLDYRNNLNIKDIFKIPELIEYPGVGFIGQLGKPRFIIDLTINGDNISFKMNCYGFGIFKRKKRIIDYKSFALRWLILYLIQKRSTDLDYFRSLIYSMANCHRLRLASGGISAFNILFGFKMEFTTIARLITENSFDKKAVEKFLQSLDYE